MRRERYPAGAPCWVDTWQPDARAARQFYGPLLGWSFDPPTPTALGGEYHTARLAGRRVSGIGEAPPSSPAAWSAYVCVADIEQALARAQAAGGTRLAGPAGVGSDGDMAILADATGVPFGLWQPGDRLGAELAGEPGTWAMSSLHTRDMDRAQAFYATLFGWKLEPVPGAPLHQWRLDGQVVAVATTTDGEAVPPHWSVNFAVADVDATTSHCTRLGGSVLMSPFNTPGMRNAVIADPQGGVIALSAAVAP